MQSETSKKSLLDETFIKICKKLKNFDKELNDKFCMLNTNFDRFRFIWSLGFIHAELDSIFDKSKLEASAKNTTKAFEHRKLGNEFYVAKKFDEALINYNESIRYAPRVHDTEHENDLALSYGNRSAVFFHIDEYRLCVSDIDRALKFAYPKHLRHKLIERKLNCFLRLEWFNEALNLLKVEGDANFQNTLKEKIKEAKELLDSCIEPHAIDRLHFGSYGKIPFSLSSTNPKMPNASSQLSIDYSFDRGFHLSASSDIQAGDLIVTERPFASILLPAYFKTHCYECQLAVDTRKMSLAFCRQCTNVTYCSPECERKSWSKSGHQHECAYIGLLSAPETGLGHMEWLALRIVLRAGWIYLAERRVDLEAYEFAYERRLGRNEAALFGADPFDELKIYKSDDYLRVFSLMTNSYVRKLNDLFRRSFVAMFLAKLLTRGEFFDSDSSDKASCFVGGLILRHIQSISCNAHEISELQFDANATKRPLASSTAQGIGAGIYAILSLFNHSCDPHVARTFRGLECQVRALRHCKRGDEVLDNYGVIYAVNEITERQERLVEQYFFECRCVACDNKWPLYDALRPVTIDKTNVKCLACRSGKPKSDCIDCVSEIDNLKLVQFNAETSLKNMLALPKDVDLENEEVMRRLEAGFGNFCFYIRALENFKIPRPIQDYNNNEEAIKQCLNLINLKYNPY